MADEKPPEQASPAKSKAGDTVLVRLMSSGVGDTFVIGDPDDGGLIITPEGVEIAANRVDDLLQIAEYNHVALNFEPVQKGN